jgi:Mg2+/Co2+ transporter CorB
MSVPATIPALEQPISAILSELSRSPEGVLPVRHHETQRIIGIIRWSDVLQLLQLKSLESDEAPTESQISLDRVA